MREKLQNYAEELSLFEDVMDKYEYIIDLGKRSSGLEVSAKSEHNKIQGCQSSVWIVMEEKEGKLFFKTDSDTVIVRGLAVMLADIFSGFTPAAIANFDADALKKLGLEEIISPVRLNGFSSMIHRIYKYAKEKNNG